MKYNDLNLWSVKNSAQKAHKQLFRLLKQFRISGSDLIAPLFDKIPPTLSSIGHETKAIFANDRIISCNDFYAKRAVDLTLEIVTHLMDGIHFETIQELTEYVKYCNDLVRKDIQYEGDNSEKEKQQGRALSERQKAVARLFKNNGTVGLSSRKGLTVNAEQLTANVVAGMPGEDTMLAKFIRHGGTLRNIVLKNFHKPNTQIGAKTMSQLKGLTEFVLNELYLCHQTVTSMREMLEKIDKAKKMLLNYLANAKDAKQSWLCGQQWLRRLQQLKYSTLKFNSLLEFMRTKLENAPECNTDSEENMILKFSGIEDTRLSQLYKQHKEYDITLDAIRKTQDATGRLLEAIQWSLLQSVGCDSIAIWKSSDISRTIDIVKSECTNINSHLSLISYVMAEEVDEAMGIIREVLEALANPTNVREAVQDISWEGIQALLIIIQNTYKQAMLIDLNSSRFMDVLRQLINLLRSLNFDKSTEAIWNLCAQLSEDNGSVKPNDLEQVVAISSTCYEILSFILGLAENSAIELAKYYMHFEAMAASLLEKGYINPIPKPPKEISENDEGQLQSFDDDIAGLGDAKGDKDVGNDIDETGQVEGLRGDEENVDEGTDKNQNDSTPLDMDDDFGGCLEDIDREQGGDSEENDEGEDGEPEADMEMGDVNQSEEDKLDSDLWNQDDDSEKELAEGNEGANKKTGNMTADNDEWDSKTDKDDKDANVDDDDNRDDKDADANDDLENMDERELLDNGRDNQNPGQVDEYNVDSNSSENKSEDDMEHVMNDKLDENDEQSEDNVEEEMQTEMIEENEEKIQEDFLDEINDAAVVQLNKDDDEVLKGGAGGMERGAVEDTMDKNAISNPNVMDENDKNIENDLAAEMESRGGIGHEESEDNNTRNEKLENLKKDDKKSGKEKKLADDITDIATQQILPSEGEQKEDEGVEFGHFDENNSSLREQIVIDKSSIEEARISKGNRDQLRDLKNINVKQNDEEIMDDNIENRSELNENDLSDTDIWNSDFQNPIIHSTTDFYHLTERSVSTNTLDADEAISSSIEAEERWNRISDSVSVLAAELSENLRMIIEPTVASRFEGDYRTGKRLNMRRLIAYIASGYRKDKIWLRRTKKAQHNYQILIAVDDSASMHDNQIKLKACQSVAMIESGLRRLEIGQLAICKFGASVKMISDFENYDGSGLGGKLISELNFSQDRTDLVSLLKCSKKIFEQARGRERNDQMLIIVSDGRGVLADGAEAIKKALAELHADQVIVLFVAIDNGEKSIMDMKVAEFTIDGNVNLTPYLQKFPFPFYMVVGRVAMLPATIGDAIRQWFELTARDS
ncbi:Midasin [Dirofilaria immitis]